MTKKIAVINDLSGFGRCSLVAAISVMSAMGVQAVPLPTAILTAQTGYPSYYCDDYVDKMDTYRKEWLKLNAHFDGIYTGFVASEEQILHIFDFIDSFYKKDSFLLVDPVMGDGGNTYAMFTDSLLNKMRELVCRADIITPNLTELCLLAHTSYDAITQLKEPGEMMAAIGYEGKKLCKKGPGSVVVTGIEFTDRDTKKPKIGNLYITDTKIELFAFPYVGGSYSGTGDLFASALVSGIARGDSMKDTIHKAGKFLELSLLDSVREQVPRNDGVNFEKHLSLLMPEEQIDSKELC